MNNDVPDASRYAVQYKGGFDNVWLPYMMTSDLERAETEAKSKQGQYAPFYFRRVLDRWTYKVSAVCSPEGL